ncbi:MAG TPA: M36 family metallopeptidase [Candidatus Ozemobacteraceae bacterium]|nr:M36 family metallopeptidase [Candidatus Ozemobacteraceae bacterium]
MKRLTACFALSFFCAASAFAFDVSPTQTNVKPTRRGPVSISENLIRAVTSRNADIRHVDLLVATEDGQRLNSLRGDLSEKLSGDKALAARRYIQRNAKLFNLPVTKDDNMLKMIRNEEAAGATHVAFQMNLDGVPVHEAEISLHIGKDDRVQLANGSFPTINEIINQITISRQDALAAAKRSLGIKKIRGVAKAEMVVHPEKNVGRMAYLVKMGALEPLGDWEVLIDAETGKEISRVNQMVFAEAHTGKGNVFVNHPLAAPASVETLNNLLTHGLEGLYCKAVNEDTAGSVNENDEHIYDPDNTHFDEANIYYYINTVHDFFKKMGYDKLDWAIKATVHVGDKYDNAYYSPMENAMAFGDGNRLNDLAKEESVAYHEYSHAHIAQIVRLNYSAESGAMNEGQADYFACTISNDDKVGEYAMNKMGKPYLRILTNNMHYPESIEGEVHADGRIWGAILWDIRNALGAEVADLLIHKSFYYLKAGSPKFIDGANAIFTADKNIFGGKYADKLREVFNKRGVTKAGDPTVLTGEQLESARLFNEVHGE